jgi:xylulokinase
MYVIGIDSGTQGTKALIVDLETGEVRGRGYSAHAMIEGLGPGASEQDPWTWVLAFESALAAALKENAIDPKNVAAIGVSGQQHGFVPLDGDGLPIRPAKLWNDTSTVEETDLIIERLGGKTKTIEKLGIAPAVGFTASKILWLKMHEPENFAKLATVLLPHNFLNFHLTGRLHMEYGDASGTGLMDIRKREWSAEALAAVDPDLAGKLPPLTHPKEPVGLMRKEIAARFGLGRVLVAGGGGDNMMGAVGTGNVIPGVCTLSLGTSGTVYSFVPRPFIDPEGEIAAFCDSTGSWLPLLCTMNVTNTTEMFKAIHELSNEGLETLASGAAPGAGGLVFLPFIDGERVPVLSFGSGVLFGLDRRTFNKSHMARAVIEGTVLNLGFGFNLMRALGMTPSEIRATGGGAKSGLWLQIVADVFRTPVVTLKEREAAAYGAALQAIWAFLLDKGERVGIADITKERVKLDCLAAEPNPKNFETYDILQTRFNSLWTTLKDEFEKHRKISSKNAG